MGLKHWTIVQGILLALNFVEHSGKIEEIGDDLDVKLGEIAGSEKGSEKIQTRLVRKVLMALSRCLMKDNKYVWRQILEEEVNGLGK